jgi:hypothetical protein
MSVVAPTQPTEVILKMPFDAIEAPEVAGIHFRGILFASLFSSVLWISLFKAGETVLRLVFPS